MKLKNLNGWQRLWVVVSLVWLGVLAGVVIIEGSFPTVGKLEAELARDKAELKQEWVCATIDATAPASGISESTEVPEGFVLDRNLAIREGFKDLSDQEFVEQVHEQYSSVDFGPVDADYQKKLGDLDSNHREKLDGLMAERAGVIGLTLLVWLITSLGVYLCAWGGWRVVVWVWRGFRLKGESNE